ncbi:hypothetical protein CH299_28245 [Rhodococcus sp. 14-2686-1-2]|nr:MULTISPECIES: hypothetical protein [unclassified Rhodococcus (in: high G+C Gram-positive bacteria)]OZE92814.1 hypothetical protein CH301_27730 [Rhodococcus sp. 15-1189-1-1a]OZF08069.1 hypothetical protein CH299_28245 [Rhodococcus sp. 14-2686-1-2]
MQLIDSLLAPAASYFDVATESYRTLPREDRKKLKGSVRIWGGDLSDSEVPDQKVDTHQYGPQMPPFDDMWLEFESIAPLAPSLAVRLRHHELFFGGTRYIQRDLEFWVMVERELIKTAFEAAFYVDPHHLDQDPTSDVWMTVDGIRRKLSAGEMLRDRRDQLQREVAMNLMRATMTAVGLMNCKNVTVERQAPVGSRSSNKNVRKTAKLDFHTIHLPGSTSAGLSLGNSSYGPISQHRVRGHFKTFTAEAPLMGKHVGTYWWGWQIRGKAADGIVVGDYRLDTTT